MKLFSKAISVVLATAICFTSVFSTTAVVSAAELITYGGTFENVYAQWADTNPSLATVEYKKSTDTTYAQADSALIRDYNGTARVDIPGLSEGTYDLKITTSDNSVITQQGINVEHYDRSGYAHFQYTDGVGAYKDDGTPKDNAIILHVTEQNKDAVSITDPVTGKTVVGLGNILNANSDSNLQSGENVLMKNLADRNIPVIIRIIGTVSKPAGTTDYSSTGNGGTKGDNGCMARMKNARNVTIEGIGYDATIYGWGIHFMALESGYGKGFEVRNITFDDYPEDAVGMEGVMSGGVLTVPVERTWIHHNSFLSGYCANPAESDKAEGDGSCDFKRGQYYTLAYNYFEDCHKTNLIGASDSNPQFNITFHHNWWKNCGSRGPLARQANIHIYNNFYDGNSNTTQDARANCYIFSEANFFNSCKNPYKTKSGAVIKAYKDVTFNCTGNFLSTLATKREQAVSNSCKYSDFDTNPDIFYYNASTNTSDVEHLTTAVVAKADCIAYSGVMKQTPITPVVEPVITANPTTAVTVPYSIDFTTNDARTKMAANNVTDLRGTEVNVDGILYSATSSYTATGSTAYLKYKGAGIVFKLDAPANVTVSSTSAGKYGVVLANSYGEVQALVPIGGTSSVDVPAGIYLIQCENSEKECYVGSFAINPEGSGPTTTEPTTETTTANEYVLSGTYNIGTNATGVNDCTQTEGRFGNIDYDFVTIDENGGTLLADGNSGVSFKVKNDTTLKLNISGNGATIIALSGSVNSNTSAVIEAGESTVSLTAGSYTIEAKDSSQYSVLSQLVFSVTEPTTETTSETPTETTTEGNNYLLNADSIAANSYSQAFTCGTNNFFTITATSSKIIKVQKSQIQLQGAGTSEYRSVLFTMPNSGSVTVTAKSSGSERTLVIVPIDAVKLADNSAYDKELGRITAVQSSADAVASTIQIPTAGTYYITSLNGGININSVSVAVDEGEQQPTVETSTQATTETTVETSTLLTTQTTVETSTEETTVSPNALSSARINSTNGSDMIIVAGIDSLNFKEAGFILESNGKEVRRSLDTVYGSIDNSTHSLSDLGKNYMLGFTITDVPNYSTQIKITPYAIDQNGNEITAESTTYSINDLVITAVPDVVPSTSSIETADIKPILAVEEEI